MTPAVKKSRTVKSPRKAAPSEIAPGVFVGGWADAEKFEGTRFCVLDETPDAPFPAEVHIPIYDSQADRPIRPNLDRLADLVAAARAKHQPVLLFCGHGIRRGPLAGAWYLHRQLGLSLEEAYGRVRTVRPKIEAVEEWVNDASVLSEP